MDGDEDEDEGHDKSIPPLCIRYLKFIFQFQNLVDLICILPYWVQLLIGETGGHAFNFVRVIRVIRIFKLLRFSDTPQTVLRLLVNAMKNSLPALGTLVVFLLLGMILFGSLIYELEGGTFVVNKNHPEGAYLRVPSNGVGLEISPFNSIPSCFYWALTTLVTGS